MRFAWMNECQAPDCRTRARFAVIAGTGGTTIILADHLPKRGYMTMSRNALILAVGILAAEIGILAYLYYEERQKTTGIQIEFGEHGVTLETKQPE